jgi:hypothetical protein
MPFNLETGDTETTKRALCCWMADGNLWIAGDIETSIQQFPIKEFCDLVERSRVIDEYIDVSAGGLTITLEDLDEDTRNLCFWNGSGCVGKLFIGINLRVEVLAKLAKYLKDILGN